MTTETALKLLKLHDDLEEATGDRRAADAWATDTGIAARGPSGKTVHVAGAMSGAHKAATIAALQVHAEANGIVWNR